MRNIKGTILSRASCHLNQKLDQNARYSFFDNQRCVANFGREVYIHSRHVRPFIMLREGDHVRNDENERCSAQRSTIASAAIVGL